MLRYITKITALIVISLLVFQMSSGINASTVPDFIRVGMYYDSNARPNMKISAEGGLSIGYYQGTEFYEAIRFEGNDGVIVRKDTYFRDSRTDVNGIVEYTPTGIPPIGDKWGPYHLQYYYNLPIEDAQGRVVGLRNRGISAYVAAIGSSYHVWGGNYISKEEALAAQERSEVACEVTDVSDRRINVVDAKTGETVFLFGHMELGLGIRPISAEKFRVDTSAVTHYRGGFDFRRINGGNLTVVNVINLEHYLYQVLANEMSSAWHIEALKAQAVTARNYALLNLNKHKSQGFDICNQVHCQAYLGLNAEQLSCISAVEQTRGKLLLYNGEIAYCYYSSSMGAFTEDAANVWGTHFPYLVSVDNSFEDTANISNGKWKNTLTAEQATEIMKANGRDVGEVTDISVTERTNAGYVLALTVTGTQGQHTFMRESTRNIFKDVTLSQRYWIEGDTGESAPVDTSVYILTGSGQQFVGLQNLSVLTGSGGINIMPSAFFARTVNGISPAYGIAPESKKSVFTFSGEGWGHGVGMSQYGAKAMAEMGMSYEAILTHYFKGAYVQ